MKNNNLKIFMSYYKPHKTLLIIDLICAFILALLDLVLPVLSRSIINEVIVDKDLSRLLSIGLLLLAIYLVQTFLVYFISYWGHVMGSRIEYDLRKDIFNHIQTLPHTFFDKTQTGQIMSRIVNDLDRLSEFAHHGPEDLFLSSIMFIGSVIIMMTYQWRLALIVMIFIPLLLFFAMKKRRIMTKSFADLRKRISQINGDLENSLSGIRVVKAFSNETYEKEKFDIGNTNYRDSMKTAFRVMAEFFTGITFMIGLLNGVVLIYGAYLVINNLMDVGSLVAFLLLINFFMNPIRKLVNFVEEYQKSMTGFDRFQEVMNTKSDITEIEDPIIIDKMNGHIEFNNVTFSYENDDSKVLNNLNLNIEKGKTLALVGPSGGGKTTLSHLIPRFYDVTNGVISIDGVDIKDMQLSSLRKHVGIVQQQVFLFTGTIKDNIKYGNLDASEEEIIDAAKKARIHDFVMTLENGYDSEVGEKGVMLSGGQKQRISIARVFLKNPSILILDEATSALDNETEILIQEALEDLSRGRTSLVIAHRLSTIRNADEIIVLSEDGIKEKGSHSQLIALDGTYSKLYNSQFKGFIPDQVESNKK